MEETEEVQEFDLVYLDGVSSSVLVSWHLQTLKCLRNLMKKNLKVILLQTVPVNWTRVT